MMNFSYEHRTTLVWAQDPNGLGMDTDYLARLGVDRNCRDHRSCSFIFIFGKASYDAASHNNTSIYFSRSRHWHETWGLIVPIARSPSLMSPLRLNSYKFLSHGFSVDGHCDELALVFASPEEDFSA
jgi:hypothetical protein